MTSIHPTAVVSPDATLGRNVCIGPYVIIESAARIGAGCRLAAHAVVKQGTELGEGNEVGEGAVLGGAPQHLKAGDRVGAVQIGDGNTIRENATIHRALEAGHFTRVGNRNLIMVNAHVAHDCRLGDHTIIANNVMLAGHVTVEDRAYLSGAVAVHQFCRIGRHAMVGGQAHVKQDVPPYVTVDGHASLIVGLNIIGLRRHGLGEREIQQLKDAYRVIYRSGMKWSEVLARLREEFPEGPAAAFHVFLSGGTRGFMRERRPPPAATLRVWQEQQGDAAAEAQRKAS